MHNQSIRGLLMGIILGLALWLMLALAIFYSTGYLPRTLPYLWWLLGVLMIAAAVEVALASFRERPATTLQPVRRS